MGLGKLNLIQEDICTKKDCCGWKIILAGKDLKDLKEIKK